MSTAATMTPDQARSKIAIFYRVFTGRERIGRVEAKLKINCLDALRDDDLVVIFAEELLQS